MPITVDRRLFLTADQDRLVDPDDPAAAFLWAGPGDEVEEADAERLGYQPGEEKEAEAPDDKALEPDEDKAEPEKPKRRTRKAAS